MFRDYSTVERVPYVNQKASGKELYHCEICDNNTMGWESESEVQFHKITHTADLEKTNNPICWLCIKEFESQEDVTHHLYTDHLFTSEDALRIEREIFICDYCNAIFFNKYVLVSHLQMRHKKHFKTKFISCPVCFKSLKLTAAFSHLYNFHSLSGYTSCPICLLKCRNRKHLLTHMKNHPKHLFCQMCHKNFENTITFRDHILEVHSKTSEEVDNVVEDVFRFFIQPIKKANVGRAVLNVTRGFILPEPFILCIFCRQLCRNDSEMSQHIMMNHTNVDVKTQNAERVFKCECGERFNHNIILKQHSLKCNSENKEAETEVDMSSIQSLSDNELAFEGRTEDLVVVRKYRRSRRISQV